MRARRSVAGGTGGRVAQRTGDQASRSTRPTLPPELLPCCRLIAFEAPSVEPRLRVATSTVARLYEMVRKGELDVDIGRICENADEFAAEWDKTPEGVPIVVIANLKGSAQFLSAITSSRPEVVEAYWIVYETLRCDVASSKTEFLVERRGENRARVVGYGPRNVIEAARRGSEAVRGHVEWGFGKQRLARAAS
jgi:hypothetical protein